MGTAVPARSAGPGAGVGLRARRGGDELRRSPPAKTPRVALFERSLERGHQPRNKNKLYRTCCPEHRRAARWRGHRQRWGGRRPRHSWRGGAGSVPRRGAGGTWKEARSSAERVPSARPTRDLLRPIWAGKRAGRGLAARPPDASHHAARPSAVLAAARGNGLTALQAVLTAFTNDWDQDPQFWMPPVPTKATWHQQGFASGPEQWPALSWTTQPLSTAKRDTAPPPPQAHFARHWPSSLFTLFTKLM